MARRSTSLLALALMVGLAACSAEKKAAADGSPGSAAEGPPATEQAALPSQADPAAPAWGDDDPNHPQPDPSPLGKFDLWEDVEGGTVCPVELENVRTIGGYTLVFDEACLARIQVGYPGAWFPAEDGSIVLIDETRKVLVTLKKLRTDEYYAQRAGAVAGVENLNLTRP